MMPSLKQARRDVREGLAALPAPKFAYDVDVPDAVPEDAPVAAMELEPDARAVDEARAEALRQQELAKLARRSLAVQKDLPRPRNPPALVDGARGRADDLIGLVEQVVDLGLGGDGLAVDGHAVRARSNRGTLQPDARWQPFTRY